MTAPKPYDGEAYGHGECAAEIERLRVSEEGANHAFEIEHRVARECQDEIDTLRARVAELEAERDEARTETKLAKREMWAAVAGRADDMVKLSDAINSVKDEREIARARVAALEAALGEVIACGSWSDAEYIATAALLPATANKEGGRG